MHDKKALLDDYEREAEEILHKMYLVLLRAQRKVEDVKYREALAKAQGLN